MKWNAFDPNCPTRDLLDRVADKWTVLVISSLDDETKRFGELKRALGNVSQKVLTEVLRSLERDGLVSRRPYATVPPRVEYRLTPLGRSLHQLVDGMRVWAEGNIRGVMSARRAYAKRDRRRRS